jgi:hypothetical protein
MRREEFQEVDNIAPSLDEPDQRLKKWACFDNQIRPYQSPGYVNFSRIRGREKNKF